MLRVHWGLAVKDDFRVHLAQLVDLDVCHGGVVVHHLLAWLRIAVVLAR